MLASIRKMNDDKVKNLATPILVIIIVLICFAIYLANSIRNEKQKAEKRESNFNFVYSGDIKLDIKQHAKIEKADKAQEFFDTEKCIDAYLKTLGRLNRTIYLNLDENSVNNKLTDTKEQVYSMLDEEYIFKYDLTIDNMDERFSYFYNTLEFLTENMYVLDDEKTHTSVYFVYGNLVNAGKNTIQQYGFIIRRNPRKRVAIYNNTL